MGQSGRNQSEKEEKEIVGVSKYCLDFEIR